MEELKKDIIEYLPKLIDAVKSVSENFHSGNYDKGFSLLQQVIQGVDWVSKAYSSLAIESMQQIKELNNWLNESNEALIKKDYITVGDIFEYEVSGVLTNMLNIVNDISYS